MHMMFVMLSGELHKNKSTYKIKILDIKWRQIIFPKIISNNKSSVGKGGKLEQLLWGKEFSKKKKIYI